MANAITEPMLLDKTGKRMLAEMARANLLKETEIGKGVSEVEDWGALAAMVDSGYASAAFPVNSKISLKWTDNVGSKQYDMKHRILGYQARNIKGGLARNLMFLQPTLALPIDTQFDAIEAFYAAPAGGLKAGTYYITCGSDWGKMVRGQTYQFTTTIDLSEGGQLSFQQDIYNAVPSKVYSYATCGAAEAQESVPVTVGGSAGTRLGTITTGVVDESGAINNLNRAGFGSNRWATSGIRQWLNSDKPKNTWWTPQTKWDRPPNYASTRDGYLAGFEDKGFLERVPLLEVKTAKPYCDGGTDGGTECDVTYDRFWLPCAEDLYWNQSSYGIPSGLEGKAFDYYRQLSGSSSPTTTWAEHKEYIMCEAEAPTSARNVFERSAYRGSGGNVSVCRSSGTVGDAYACCGYRAAPACAFGI